jgi:hypothetical protein
MLSRIDAFALIVSDHQRGMRAARHRSARQRQREIDRRLGGERGDAAGKRRLIFVVREHLLKINSLKQHPEKPRNQLPTEVQDPVTDRTFARPIQLTGRRRMVRIECRVPKRDRKYLVLGIITYPSRHLREGGIGSVLVVSSGQRVCTKKYVEELPTE